MPFVSAFAFTGTISFPLIFAVFLFMLMGLKVLKTGKFPNSFFGFDIMVIFLLLFFVVFTFVINGWGNSKSLNHTVAYLSTFLLFYVTIKFTLFAIKDKELLFKRVLQFITYTTILSALYSNAEFISSNVFKINLNDYVPRPSEAEEWYDATVLGLFYRARGFAPESGHFTFMMELFFPIVIYYIYFTGFCKWNKILKALTIFSIVLSFIFAVSTASFAIVPASFLVASAIYAKRIFFYIKKHFLKIAATTVVTSAIILALNYFFSFYTFIFLSITDKLDSGSFDQRQAKIDFFYDTFSRFDVIKKLSGSGPGGFYILGFDRSNSILSFYHNITFEIGLFGLLLILALFFYVLVSVSNINGKIGFFLLASFMSGVLHFFIIANFWYPWFWFIAAFIIFCNKKIGTNNKKFLL